MFDGSQYQQFMNILLRAYQEGPAGLKRMLKFQLDKDLDAIALGSDLTEIIFKVIQNAEARGWTAKLMVAARADNPDNAQLLAFVQQFGLAPRETPPRDQLERMIKDSNSFLNINEWRTQLGKLEGRICRIETESTYGTGFLIGPSVVLTNYHVMRSVINGSNHPESTILRFDYKQLADGTTIDPGTIYHLPKHDWLIDASPMSAADYEPEPHSILPTLDELDYALLCIDGTPGSDAIGKATPALSDDVARGFISLPNTAYEFKPDTPLFIIQHPKGEPLKLALDTQAIISVNANQTRVRYRTNTELGSSGSPCFNSNWQLVALHHSGDPDQQPIYNQGIPIYTIFKTLESRGHKDAIGEQAI